MCTLLPALLLGLVLGSPPGAGEDLRAILQALERASEAKERLGQIPRLVALQTSGAAGVLAVLVRDDPDHEVRVAAAEGLGRMRTDNARRLLVERIVAGGPRGVRAALARGLAARGDGLSALLEILSGGSPDPTTASLVLEALGRFPQEEALKVLQEHASGTDPHLQGAALRALQTSAEGRERVPALLSRILRQSRDPDVLLGALDLVEDLEEAAMRPLAERLATFLEPAVQEAAAHLAARLRHLEAVRLAREAAREGYGTPDLPPPPPDRPRFDLVFIVDVTGSTTVVLPRLKERIRSEATLLQRMGGSVRVGVVGYRAWKDISLTHEHVQTLPLTFDLDKVDAFLEEMDSGGADSQGADVSVGLEQGLGRMGWRWGNTRRVAILLADSRCHDPRSACATAGVHQQGDQTRTRVLYVLRTRRKVPEDLQELARLGGTRTVELLE